MRLKLFMFAIALLSFTACGQTCPASWSSCDNPPLAKKYSVDVWIPPSWLFPADACTGGTMVLTQAPGHFADDKLNETVSYVGGTFTNVCGKSGTIDGRSAEKNPPGARLILDLTLSDGHGYAHLQGDWDSSPYERADGSIDSSGRMRLRFDASGIAYGAPTVFAIEER